MKAVPGLFLLVCLSAGLSAGPAAAVPLAGLPGSHIFSPLPATISQYTTLSSLDFHPANSILAYTQGADGSLYPDSTAPAQFSARLDLPSDATVSDVVFYFVDNTSPADIQFKISAYDPDDGGFDIWSVIPARNSSAMQTISFSAQNGYPFDIQNDAYSYQLLVFFNAPGGVQKLYGATVTYTESGVLPTDDHITFVGTDFHPAASDINFASSGIRVYCTAGSSPCSFLAPIYLPQGSQVTEIDYYVVDNNSSHNLTMQVNGFNPLTNNLSAWGAGSTIGLPDSDNVQTISKTGNPLFTIDNTTRGYAVFIQPTMTSMEQMLLGARIHFKPEPTSNSQVRTLAGYDFRPNLSKVEYDTSGGTIYPEDNEQTGPFTANLDLPDGSVVYQLTVYFKKLSGVSGNFTIEVKRYLPGSGIVDMLQSCNSNAISAGDTLKQLSFPGTVAGLGQMDAQKDNLRLMVTPSAADDLLVLYGAQVQYFFPLETFLSLIRN